MDTALWDELLACSEDARRLCGMLTGLGSLCFPFASGDALDELREAIRSIVPRIEARERIEPRPWARLERAVERIWTERDQHFVRRGYRHGT
jgi:hypothetical protein